MSGKEQSDEFLEVVGIDILAGGPDEHTISDTFLRFKLEDQRQFIMSGIPSEIAFELHQHISDMPIQDSRFRLSTLIGELAVVKKVTIDSVVPTTSAYQATIELVIDGLNRPMIFPMVPSHATLLAVVAGAPVFVSRELVEMAHTF